jgi:glycosyltransferase involved in cell wall biosynthesis
MTKAPTLYIVVPCYNEKEVLPETSKRLKKKIDELKKSTKISIQSRITFVNDGSKDNTWRIIQTLHAEAPDTFSGINLSRNRGHQNALLGGLMTVKDRCDVSISMDADLQDDINAIDGMLDAYNKGSDVVYGVRSARENDTMFKRMTAEGFYKIMKFMGADVVFNHADYRLMSRRALEGLAMFKEVNLFLRGIVPLVGYKSEVVKYERSERFAGESKYPLKKMLSFAVNGITSFSIKPIRLVSALGFVLVLIGLSIFIYSLYQYFIGQTTEGWTSILISLWLIGGMIMISLGVVGEYVGKIYLESKHRPSFIIESFLDE